MRFPFFKGGKEEQTINTRTTIPVRRSASSPLADTQPLERIAAKPAPTSREPQPTIQMGVGSMLPQLPHTIFTEAGREQLSALSLALPVHLVLPQLATGKVSIALPELLQFFPAHLLRNPLPPVTEQQAVVLPLHEVIAAIPPELLATSPESEIRADDPELDKLPKLVDEDLLNAAKVQPQAQESKPSSAIVVPPRPRTTGAPEFVMVSLRALVAVMPDAVFCCPRTELAAKLNLDTPALLPTEPILPQLRSASAKLPLSIVLSVIPHQVLANPMPALDGQLIPIPLAEIIPQLPKSVFTDALRPPTPELEPTSLEIPDPFQERSTTAEQPAESAPAPEPLAGELGMDSTQLEDESFSIFAERTPTAPTPVEPEPVAAEPVAAEPVSEEPTAAEPATEEPVVAEPVAEVVAPVEPVAEVAVPAEPEPVVEEALPAEPAPVAASATTSEPAALDERKLLIDLNRCSVEDLTAIPGIGRALAQRIIDFRSTRGHFNAVDELRQVPGIGRKTFRALTGVQPRALNRLLGAPHDGELTLQEIVRLTGKLPGIEGCMLATADGLFLTGELPAHLDQATISVFAPQLFKKVGRYARELKVGSIRRFTIFTDTQPISIFRAADVYLIVIHDAFRFSKALLRRCERISQEIARLSSQRVTV